VPRRQAAISALLVGLLVVGLIGATAPRAHADQIGAKRAQAQGVLMQLQRLDAAAQRANSRYQSASRGLRHVEHELGVNRLALGVAHGNLARSQRSLENRLVAIYTTEDQQSSLAVILGARSLDDLISRIETVNSISKQDSALIHQVLYRVGESLPVESWITKLGTKSIVMRQELFQDDRVVLRADAICVAFDYYGDASRPFDPDEREFWTSYQEDLT